MSVRFRVDFESDGEAEGFEPFKGRIFQPLKAVAVIFFDHIEDPPILYGPSLDDDGAGNIRTYQVRVLNCFSADDLGNVTSYHIPFVDFPGGAVAGVVKSKPFLVQFTAGGSFNKTMLVVKPAGNDPQIAVRHRIFRDPVAAPIAGIPAIPVSDVTDLGSITLAVNSGGIGSVTYLWKRVNVTNWGGPADLFFQQP